jgi:hypothetical protein
VTGSGGELVVAAKSKGFERTRNVDTHGAGAQLELVQKAVELARQAAEVLPAPEPARPDYNLPPETPPAPEVVPQPRFAVGIDGGVLTRGANDAIIGVRARVALWQRVGPALMLAATQSASNGVDVRELHALLGISDEWILSPRLGLEVSLVGGVRQHHFETTMPLAEPTGDRIDAEGCVVPRVGWRPVRAVEVGVWAAACISRARAHVLGTQVLWQRDSSGFGAGAGIAFRF